MTKLTLRASNKNTGIEKKIHLTLRFVVFVITPESQAIVLGHQFRLDCAAFEATDETPLTYSWEFNGQPIEASNIASEVTVFAICVGVCVRIFTARKRCLRQGNVSTPVYLCTGGGGVMMSLPVVDSTHPPLDSTTCFYTCLSFCSQGGGVWYPSMHFRSPGPHPRGS